jgi:hypothetical protein
MASVNINSDIADPFYRYKMPRIIAKVLYTVKKILKIICEITNRCKFSYLFIFGGGGGGAAGGTMS